MPARSRIQQDSASKPSQDGSLLPSFEAPDEDEDVLIAVQALGNMRHRGVHPPSPLNTDTTSITNASTPALTPCPSSDALAIGYDRDIDLPLSARMSELPFVTSAIRAYEHGKAKSRVVKFGAEIVESSVLTVTRPVLSQIDGFASRKLGRLSTRLHVGTSFLSSSSTLEDMSQDSTPNPSNPSPTEDSDIPERRNGSATPNRWQNVLLEAGGIGVAVSSESMRKLKFCLQWLQYATARIDDQILALQNCLRVQSSNIPTSEGRRSISSRMIQINQIRGDLVNTIRQVVEVISNYAGSALPEPARTRVREFILSLPQRWANAQTVTSTAAERPESPRPVAESSAREEVKGRVRTRSSRHNSVSSADKRVPPASEDQDSEQVNVTATASRLLTLATESLDMLHNVTTIFNQSLERAEAWVERLRVVGLEPQGDSEPEEAREPPRRAGSTSTISSPFPETPMTRPSQPPSQTTSDGETDSEEDPDRPPRKTRRTDPER